MPVRLTAGKAESVGFLKLMKYWIYILKSINYEKTYVGLTSNLHRRLDEHNKGKSNYTNKFKPWKFIYTEEIEGLTNARAREKYFKSAAGRKKIKKILDSYAPVAQQDIYPDLP